MEGSGGKVTYFVGAKPDITRHSSVSLSQKGFGWSGFNKENQIALKTSLKAHESTQQVRRVKQLKSKHDPGWVSAHG